MDAAFGVEDGLRILRNFAKRGNRIDLLKAVYEKINKHKSEEIGHTGLQHDALCEASMLFKLAYR